MARTRAPELHGAGGWFNTDRPLTLADLRGKIVVLDFWTSCCVNCLRLLEELRPIEERYADVLVVVGIHSPKFPHEADHAAVERAVARHRVRHAVLDDPELATWQQYTVKGWPTLVVIDPEGYVVGTASGEGSGPLIEQAVERLTEEHAAKGTLVRGPLPYVGAPAEAAAGALLFPGKVATDGERLAVADTGHGRVVVCDLDGRVERVIEGLADPQGVRFDGDAVVVCETGADRVVLAPAAGGPVTVAEGLASPWDVVVVDSGTYLVAEAGRHKLWEVSAGTDKRPVAGTGAEGLVDGPAAHAVLAQPSGLALTGAGIAFVDAEASALRVLTDDDRVVTLVGAGLFEWGTADGPSHVARLQHPLGVAAAPGTDDIYVADTFNSLLRVWEGKHEMLRGLAVDGLDEPGGLDVLPDGRLVVADTNNHRVVLVDARTGAVEALVLDESWLDVPEGEALWLAPGARFRLPYAVDLAGDALDPTDGPPVRVTVEADPGSLLGDGPRRWDLSQAEGQVHLAAGRPGSGSLTIEVAAATCDDDRCTVRRERRRHPLTVREGLSPS